MPHNHLEVDNIGCDVRKECLTFILACRWRSNISLRPIKHSVCLKAADFSARSYRAMPYGGSDEIRAL
jgi:hypothetical protein